MANYEEWNKAIFQHYFNKSSSDLVFFCVDEKAIEYIGKNLGLQKESAVIDFCTAVVNKCKKITTVDLGLKNLKYSNGIPYQTAVIAFTILAASRMNKDNNFISSTNFWGRVDELIQSVKGAENCTAKKRWLKDNNTFLDMLSDFTKQVGFEFPTLFNYGDQKNDIAGRPIFQSMISTADKIKLLKNFEKYVDQYNNKESNFPFKEICDGKTFSRAFQTIRDDATNYELLKRRVYEFYKICAENGFEYDENNRLIKVRLKIGYKYLGEGQFQFFYFLKDNDEFSKLQDFEQIIIHGEKYYYSPFNDKMSSLLVNRTINLDKNIVEINKNIKKDFIIFKNIGENYYLETRNIIVDDTFSILSNKQGFSIFNEDYEAGRFEQNDNDGINNQILIKDTEFILWHNLCAIKYGDYILINKKNKYGFKHGLKSDLGLYNYIQNAEPFFEFEDLEYIKIFQNGEPLYKIKNSPFDIRKQANDIGVKYSITLEKSSMTDASYTIDKLEQNSFNIKDFKYIYHIVTPKGIIKSFDSQPQKTICSGAAFKDFATFYVQKSEQNNTEEYNKIRYILSILKLHTNEKIYPMPYVIRSWAETFKTKNIIINDTIEYIKQNKFIDNYVNIYLKEIGKVLKW